jgi:hypothetical protein
MKNSLPAIALHALAMAVALSGTTRAASASSLGTFKANGKDASLSSAVLVGMLPSDSTPRMVLVLSEKAPPAGVDPNMAMLANPEAFGDAVSVVLLKYEGEDWSNPVGCNVVHRSAKKKHGDYLDANSCKLTDVSAANGEFHAHLVTTPSAKDGDDSIAIDVTLNLKMP